VVVAEGVGAGAGAGAVAEAAEGVAAKEGGFVQVRYLELAAAKMAEVPHLKPPELVRCFVVASH
jgi:hypothetical protein